MRAGIPYSLLAILVGYILFATSLSLFPIFLLPIAYSPFPSEDFALHLQDTFW